MLLPVNFVLLDRPDYRADVERLLEVCTERGIAVQTIKSIAKGRWHDGTDRHFSWYEPLTDPAAIARAVRYVLSDPQVVPQHDERRPPAAADHRRGVRPTSTGPTRPNYAPTSSTTASPRSSTTTPSNGSEPQRVVRGA